MRFFVLMLPAVYALAGMVQSAVAADRSPDQPAQPTPPAEQAQSVAAPAAQAGMRVYVDPATGRRIQDPTSQQREALDARIRADHPDWSNAPEFKIERLPNGAEILRTQGQNRSVVVALPGAGGAPMIQCTDPAHQSGQQHAHDARSTKREER